MFHMLIILASQNMGVFYFETFQSLWLTNIVITLATIIVRCNAAQNTHTRNWWEGCGEGSFHRHKMERHIVGCKCSWREGRFGANFIAKIECNQENKFWQINYKKTRWQIYSVFQLREIQAPSGCTHDGYRVLCSTSIALFQARKHARGAP